MEDQNLNTDHMENTEFLIDYKCLYNLLCQLKICDNLRLSLLQKISTFQLKHTNSHILLRKV